MSKPDAKAEKKHTRKGIPLLSMVSRRAWYIGGGVVLLLALLVLLSCGNDEKTIYTDGKERHPESYRVPRNIGPLLNTVANETDPVLYSHGHEMIFSSDRGAGEVQTYKLFHSRTTEVIPIVEVAQVTPRATGSFWHYLQDYKWWILLLLLALLALLALLKNFLNEETRRTLSLLQRCLLGSIALHILLAFLLSVWVLSHAVYKTIKEEQVLELALNEADVAIQQMSQEIREVVPDLPQAQADLPTEQPVEPASAVVQPPSVDPSRPVEVQQENKPNSFAVQPTQAQPTPIPPETLAEMTRPPVLPDKTTSAEPRKQEQGTAQAQASRTLSQASAQAKLAAAQTQNAEANPQATDAQSVKAEQAAKMAAAQTANPVDAQKPAESVETAQTQNNLPKLEAARSETQQEQGTAQAQASRTLSQASAQAKLAASQTQNAEANPQATDAQSVKAEQAAKMAAAQTANPVDAQKPAESVETAQTQNNLPKLEAARSETQQEQGTAQAQASRTLQKATQRQAVKVTAKANQLQSQPNIVASLAKTEVLAQQVATAAVTNAAPIRLSAAAAGSLNTVTISPNEATAPIMATGKTSLEQAKPEAKAGQGLVVAKKTSALQAAKVNTPEAEASTKAKATGPANNVAAKNVAVESIPVSALVRTAQVQAAKVNVVVPNLQVAKVQTEELEVIEPTVSVEKRLSEAESKQTIDPVKLSSTQSKALRQSVPVVTVIGLKQVLRSNLKQAPALGAVQSGGMTNAKAAAPGVAAVDLVSVKVGSFDQKPIASQVARENLKSAVGTVNVLTRANPSAASVGGPVETDELVQSKALPKLGSIQLVALPTPQLNTEPLALSGAGNDVVLPDMKFKSSMGVLEAKRLSPLVGRKNPKLRLNYIERLGGSRETEEAVRRALDWFTANQERDGHWNHRAGHDVAATGMAVLAYMGWGAKHTEPGPYREPLERAVEWMLSKEQNGDMRGRGSSDMYDHGIAAIAMAEAYALTKDKRLLQPMNRIVSFTVNAQNPKTGGWRYHPYSKSYTHKGDMSVTGWQVMALKSAQMGGIKVPQVAFQRAGNFLRNMAEGGKHGGEYTYLPGRGRNYVMTAEAMFTQQLLGGFPPDHPKMQESAKYILKKLDTRGNEKYYYWYYGSLAMHQNQGESWEKWNDKLRPALLRNQVRGGREDGSWDSTGKRGPETGRCVATAMATLSLEVYYRYLPLSSPEWLKKGK